MDISRANDILTNDKKFDVFYQNRLVWIQSLNSNNCLAKIGFIDTFEEKDVLIDDLYEINL